MEAREGFWRGRGENGGILGFWGGEGEKGGNVWVVGGGGGGGGAGGGVDWVGRW